MKFIVRIMVIFISVCSLVCFGNSVSNRMTKEDRFIEILIGVVFVGLIVLLLKLLECM